jgi:two-component system sensor histidine kinase GlrK
MMKFTLLKRLTAGYGAILLLVIVLGMYVAYNLNQLTGLIRGTAADGITINQMEQLREAMFSLTGFEKKFFISQDTDFRTKFMEIRKYFSTELGNIAERMDTESKRTQFAEVRSLFGQYLALFNAEDQRIAAGGRYPSDDYERRNEVLVDGINIRLKGIVDSFRLDRENKLQTSGAVSVRVLDMTLFTGLAIIAFGILISFINARSINRSIVMLQKKTREIARGRYVVIPALGGPPEIQALADDFNRMSGKLKQLDEMKIDFINRVSHDLRTPLTAIKEASDMLMEGVYADSPEKQHQLLAITTEECGRLIKTVNRILDLSRMEVKMMEYRFQPCSLTPLIQHTVLKLAPIARSKEIELELCPVPDLPPVKVDEERIGQVLENLIGNAIKFTPEKGRVRVQAAVTNRKKDTVGVAVTDTGPGIPLADLEFIFDKFSRVSSEGQTATGSGLGLAIAKHIVEDHGGKIWARSKSGSGSTFIFVLPAA